MGLRKVGRGAGDPGRGAKNPNCTGFGAVVKCLSLRASVLRLRGMGSIKTDYTNRFMALVAEQSAVLRKTKELCETLLQDPEFQDLRLKVDQFMINDIAKGQYQDLSERGEYLQHKQEQGLELADNEVKEYEALRGKFLQNPVARGFLDAQKTMQELQETVNSYVSKTFELGRVPKAEDLEGSCGEGCGCHH